MPVTKPTPGGDDNTWGTILNAALDQHDTELSAKADTSHGIHVTVATTRPSSPSGITVWFQVV